MSTRTIETLPLKMSPCGPRGPLGKPPRSAPPILAALLLLAGGASSTRADSPTSTPTFRDAEKGAAGPTVATDRYLGADHQVSDRSPWETRTYRERLSKPVRLGQATTLRPRRLGEGSAVEAPAAPSFRAPRRLGRRSERDPAVWGRPTVELAARPPSPFADVVSQPY